MIPLSDISAQYGPMAGEIEAAVISVLRGGRYVLGPEVDAFEQEFAAFCGARRAVAVDSGTSALHLALLSLGIGPGDEVITTSATFVATVAAILYAGATPVFVDVDPKTWTIDPALIEQAITPRTKAIMPVHLHGRIADMAAIGEIAQRHRLRVIEDAAQAHGAFRSGVGAGLFGDIGCFSFYPGKNLGACGEGGAVVTDDDTLADVVRQLRDWGQEGRYNHVRRGFNNRMDALQGAALRVKLRRLPEWTSARRRIADRYRRLLQESGVVLPAPSAGEDHAYHVFAVRLRHRDRVRAAMMIDGVETGLHYPRPVHLQPAYAGLGYGRGSLPEAETLAEETLSLPIYPELSDDDVGRICASLIRASRQCELEDETRQLAAGSAT
ncbi:DegT/DnrJ/EryC1/StrS family aminotransferase [Chenggangzhangella methanolivorans]|uniref:DegT/DnrJ/EryC1/StrS family aminotransferase n=1 Tax=Chenggangzhangella methanolivorans TaxID=1437009 RepID=A0A9E6RCE0_9HYPH|nr:DegT/DnrJ/EryC1/StrS family aminotransferase [Chenggangzhangella methanolivorans]QZO01275.1 DegT/DnrJ/EryC1/StrS family aminotransferase [Chenggangzhangella methanolivorans]